MEAGRGARGAGRGRPGGTWETPAPVGAGVAVGRRAVSGRGRGVRPGGGVGREAALPGCGPTCSVSGARAAGPAPLERPRPFCPPAEESCTRPTRSGDSPLRRPRRARWPPEPGGRSFEIRF